MGKLFYDIGFLSTTEVVECSATDLIAEYVGQTGPKTQQQLQKALGKVLVIDEAHRLGQGSGWNFAAEACNEIVHQISLPKYKGKIIIVLAGDSIGMHELMKKHTNLAGHFSYVIDFPNIPPKDSIYLLAREVEALGITAPFLPPEGTYPRDESSVEWDEYYSRYTQEFDQLYPIFKLLGIYPSWHNARDIRSLAKRMAAEVFRSCGKQSPESASLTLTWEHVVTSLKPVLSEFTQRHCYGFVDQDGVNYNSAAQSLSQQLCSSQPSRDLPQMADGCAPVVSDTIIDSQTATQDEEHMSSHRDVDVFGTANSNRYMCLRTSEDGETMVDSQRSEQASLMGSSEGSPTGDPVVEGVDGADASMDTRYAGDNLHCITTGIHNHTHQPRNSSEGQKTASLHTSLSRHASLFTKAKSGVGKLSRKVIGGMIGQGNTSSALQGGSDGVCEPSTSGGGRVASRLRLGKRSTEKLETQTQATGACPWGYDWIQKAPGRWECGYGTCVREENPGTKR